MDQMSDDEMERKYDSDTDDSEMEMKNDTGDQCVHVDTDDDLILVVLLLQQQQLILTAIAALMQQEYLLITCLQVVMSGSSSLPIVDVSLPRLYPTLPPRLDIRAMTDDDAEINFRFTISEMDRIITAMQLPATFTVNHVVFTALDAVAVTLRRLAYPNRYPDLVQLFGRDEASIGRIFNRTLMHLITRYRQHLELWPGVTAAAVKRYAQAITQYQPAVVEIWAFLDGTHKDIAIPEQHQRATYSGKSRTHQLKYQLLIAPDGLFVSTRGPYVGSKHDVAMLQESRLQVALQPLVVHPHPTATDGSNLIYMIYADAAYQGQSLVMAPFRDPNTRVQRVYNDVLSSLRVSVENGFAKVSQLFPYMNLKRSQRTGLQPVALYFFISVLFTNIHTCLHHSNVPFNIDPPSLERYLS